MPCYGGLVRIVLFNEKVLNLNDEMSCLLFNEKALNLNDEIMNKFKTTINLSGFSIPNSLQVLDSLTSIKKRKGKKRMSKKSMKNEEAGSAVLRVANKSSLNVKIREEENKRKEIPKSRENKMKINKFYGTEAEFDIDDNELRETNKEFRFLRHEEIVNDGERFTSTRDGTTTTDEETATSRGESADSREKVEPEKLAAGGENVLVQNQPNSTQGGNLNFAENHSISESFKLVQENLVPEKISNQKKEVPKKKTQQQRVQNTKWKKKSINTKKIKKKQDDTLAATFKNFFSTFTNKKKSTKAATNTPRVLFDTETKSFKYSGSFKSELSLDDLKKFKGRVRQLVKYFEEMKVKNNK